MTGTEPALARSNGIHWPGTRHYAMEFDARSIDEHAIARLGVVMPEALSGAVIRRRFDFAAGRHCAAMAIAAFGAKSGPIGTCANRAPEWPQGFVGSITHSDGYVAAVVGRSSEFRGLGIDCEELLDASKAKMIRELVLTPGDIDVLTAAGLDNPLGTSLVFSAKESVYKCISPLTGTYFDFGCASLTSIDLQQGVFEFRLLSDVGPGFSADFTHFGQLRVFERHVHTGVALGK